MEEYILGEIVGIRIDVIAGEVPKNKEWQICIREEEHFQLAHF